MAYQSVNPNDGKVLQRFEHLTSAELEKALAAVEHCFQSWMRKIYARLAEASLAPVTLRLRIGEAHRESWPTLFCVEPWELPVLPARPCLLPAVDDRQCASGKPGRPRTSMRDRVREVAGRCRRARLCQYPLISLKQSDRVIDDPRSKGVALTGSMEAVSKVAGRAGQNLKWSSVELGSWDAFVMRHATDLDKPTPWAVRDRMHTDIERGDLDFCDESFGPVVAFFDVQSETDAVALTNDSNFGLGVAVRLKDEARRQHVASLFDTGTVLVNDGDGFVVTRRLVEAGWPLRVAQLVPREQVRGSAARHAALWCGSVELLTPDALERPEPVVDAIFGAGLSRALDGAAT
jgi:hypothetical protein